MVENVGRYVAMIVAFLVVSLGLLFGLDEPFRLGLDLSGGTRLVYSFDFEKARDDGVLQSNETNAEVLQSQIGIIRNRVDPTGVLDPIIRSEGIDRIVIELPGKVSDDRATAPLGAPLLASDSSLSLAGGGSGASEFPLDGGVVLVDGEKIRYAERDGDVLLGLIRGLGGGSAVGDHQADADVQLVSGDPIRTRIENLGQLQFLIVASATNKPTTTDLAIEREKLDTWLAANPEAVSLEGFNALSDQAAGPNGVQWYPNKQVEGEAELTLAQRAMPLLIETDPDWDFGGEDLEDGLE